MKKLLVFILTSMLVFSVVGCQNKQGTNIPSSEKENITVKDSLDLLNKVWEHYTDDDKFSVMGGDYNHMTDNAPGKFDIADKESLRSLLVVPEDAAKFIDDAASLMHAMNANTFTSGVFHVSESENVEKFVESMKESVLNNQWICGIPETFIIAQIGEEYVVSAFGSSDLIKEFKTQLKEVYPSAEVIIEESL